MHCVRRAASRADCTAGNSKATSTPMMAMTTSSSTRVKPPRRERGRRMAFMLRRLRDDNGNEPSRRNCPQAIATVHGGKIRCQIVLDGSEAPSERKIARSRLSRSFAIPEGAVQQLLIGDAGADGALAAKGVALGAGGFGPHGGRRDLLVRPRRAETKGHRLDFADGFFGRWA